MLEVLIIVTVILFLSMVVLAMGLNIRVNDIKELKKIEQCSSFLKITDKLPDNTKICKEMLEMLNNKNVKIRESEDKNNKTSLYIAIKNEIIIANINKLFTRVQTIAHECIHSIQNRKILVANFILSNLDMATFALILILIFFKTTKYYYIYIITYLLISFIGCSIRSYLEIDAMIRAKYLSERYLSASNVLTESETISIIEEYEKLNKNGIKLYVYLLNCKSIIKSIILSGLMIIKL